MSLAMRPDEINKSSGFLVADIGVHKSRVNHISVNTGRCVTVIQTFCKQYIAQFGLFVGRQRIVTASEHNIIPMYLNTLVGFAAGHYDTPVGFFQKRKQLVCQEESGEMVERKLLLVSFVGGRVPTARRNTHRELTIFQFPLYYANYATPCDTL